MQIEVVNEPVEVLAAFRLKGLEPLVLRWAGRDYHILKINLMYTENDGREHIHYFSVSGEGAVYRLAYRPLSFSWILEEVCLE